MYGILAAKTLGRLGGYDTAISLYVGVCCNYILPIIMPLNSQIIIDVCRYMFDDLASPEQPILQKTLSQLLTEPLAKLLRNRRPWDLLQVIHANETYPTILCRL